MRYDHAPARRIARLSETPEMRAQRDRVIELLAPQTGWRVLDVGCGPGHLAEQLAEAVRPGGRVCGVDTSREMLALAGRREIALAHVEGTALPFDDGVFDAATATQVYEFVEDLPAALAELFRVLAPGGRTIVLDTDWDSIVWQASDSVRMERVLNGWRERVADPRLPRTLSGHLREAGFEILRREAFTIFDPCGHGDAYSAHQIEHLGASAVGVEQPELDAWQADLRDLARRGDYFFSLNRYLFLAAKPT
jgi:arsenite methyltransferase